MSLGYEPFEPCLLSCEIGIEKPDLKAYQILLSQLNFPAKDIIFIDDRQEIIDAANRIGLDAILFHSATQLRRELFNMTSQVLRTLERKGYIKRHQIKGNERSKYPHVTAIGSQLIEKAIPLVEAIDREFFSKLPEPKICLDIFKKLIT